MSSHAVVAVVVVSLIAITAGLFFWIRHLVGHAMKLKNDAMRLKASAQAELQKVQKAL